MGVMNVRIYTLYHLKDILLKSITPIRNACVYRKYFFWKILRVVHMNRVTIRHAFVIVIQDSNPA